LSLALLHPEVFRIVGAHSPSFRGADGSIPFIDDWNYFNQFDPIWLVENTETGSQLTIWMDVGVDDDRVRNCGPGSNRCVEAFHELLLAHGMPHDWHDTWPGPHEGTAYWGPHIPDYLAWYSSKLAMP
jgi:S-formylglutathione hydrolase FrmB